MIKIFIDPGHGGSDPGASAHGLREKDVCLLIAMKVKQRLETTYTGHQLKLSRTSDTTVSLRERTIMANQWGADYFVSIHINAGGGTGFESYIYNQPSKTSGKTKQYQGTMHQEIMSSTDFKDRGKKAANFHVLRESAMPAILMENGFIDTASDARKLKNGSYLDVIAKGHAEGIATCFGLERIGTDNSDSSERWHTIKAGNTLWKLSKSYNTTVKKLLALNEGIDPYTLKIGTKLRVK